MSLKIKRAQTPVTQKTFDNAVAIGFTSAVRQMLEDAFWQPTPPLRLTFKHLLACYANDDLKTAKLLVTYGASDKDLAGRKTALVMEDNPRYQKFMQTLGLRNANRLPLEEAFYLAICEETPHRTNHFLIPKLFRRAITQPRYPSLAVDMVEKIIELDKKHSTQHIHSCQNIIMEEWRSKKENGSWYKSLLEKTLPVTNGKLDKLQQFIYETQDYALAKKLIEIAPASHINIDFDRKFWDDYRAWTEEEVNEIVGDGVAPPEPDKKHLTRYLHNPEFIHYYKAVEKAVPHMPKAKQKEWKAWQTRFNAMTDRAVASNKDFNLDRAQRMLDLDLLDVDKLAPETVARIELHRGIVHTLKTPLEFAQKLLNHAFNPMQPDKESAVLLSLLVKTDLIPTSSLNMQEPLRSAFLLNAHIPPSRAKFSDTQIDLLTTLVDKGADTKWFKVNDWLTEYYKGVKRNADHFLQVSLVTGLCPSKDIDLARVALLDVSGTTKKMIRKNKRKMPSYTSSPGPS